MQALFVLLLELAEPARFVRKAANTNSPTVKASPGAGGGGQLASQGEYAFNLAAFNDGRRNLVRIFSEIEPKYVEPIATRNLEKPHVNHCFFMAANGSSWSTATENVNTQWAYGDDERIRKINKVAHLMLYPLSWTLGKT